jgi:hypothetical protein
MTYIPYDLVVRGIINIMQGYGQFNNPEAGSEMAGIGTDLVNDKLSEFITDPDQIKLIQFPEIFRSVYFVEQPRIV